MPQPHLLRPLAILSLAFGLLYSVPGCNETKPTSSEKKDQKKNDSATNPDSDAGKTTPGSEPGTALPTTLPPAEKIDLNIGVGQDATNFLKSLLAGDVKADQLTLAFQKAIGLPAEFPGDKAKGYSADAAVSLLRRIGSNRNLSLPFLSKQVGDVALFRGTIVNSDQPGSYALRMIHEGGAWKVDWFSLTSVKIEGAVINASNGETACQEFAAAAAIGTLLDTSALSPNDRAVILAAGLTPEMRKKWAEPFESDKGQGFDYNPASLAQKASKYSAGAESCSITQIPNTPDFHIEVSRAGNQKSAYLVKLVKGPGPGQWLVNDVTPQ